MDSFVEAMLPFYNDVSELEEFAEMFRVTDHPDVLRRLAELRGTGAR